MQVDGRGEGIVSFGTHDDMERALREVDGTGMRNMRGECKVYVDPAGGGGGGRGGDGPSRRCAPRPVCICKNRQACTVRSASDSRSVSALRALQSRTA